MDIGSSSTSVLIWTHNVVNAPPNKTSVIKRDLLFVAPLSVYADLSRSTKYTMDFSSHSSVTMESLSTFKEVIFGKHFFFKEKDECKICKNMIKSKSYNVRLFDLDQSQKQQRYKLLQKIEKGLQK